MWDSWEKVWFLVTSQRKAKLVSFSRIGNRMTYSHNAIWKATDNGIVSGTDSSFISMSMGIFHHRTLSNIAAFLIMPDLILCIISSN